MLALSKSNVLEGKKLKSRSHRVTESRSFLVRYRRTYVLKNRDRESEIEEEIDRQTEERMIEKHTRLLLIVNQRISLRSIFIQTYNS